MAPTLWLVPPAGGQLLFSFISAQRPGITPGRLITHFVMRFLFLKCELLFANDYPFSSYFRSGGDEGIRTPGLRRAKAALSHLSYIPGWSFDGAVGLTGLEPVTPALSAQCSNHLSYRPLGPP